MKTHLQTQLNCILTEYNRYTPSGNGLQDSRDTKIKELISRHLHEDQIQTRHDQKRKSLKGSKVDPSMMRKFKTKLKEDENQKLR